MLTGMQKAEEINNTTELLPRNIRQTPTIASGYSNYQYKTYYYKIGTRVVLSVGIHKNDNTPISGVYLFTLPEGYRPSNTIYAPFFNDALNSVAPVGMFSDGRFYVYSSSDKGVFGNIEFDAFEATT